MTDRSIIFSTPEIRALLAGRKTQARLVLKHQPSSGLEVCIPYRVGDSVWVKETWATVNSYDGPGWAYRANDEFIQPDYDGPNYGAGPSFNYTKYPGEYSMWYSDLLAGVEGHGWTPSTHMPRWASRITLIVSNVRVQLLQEISCADAFADAGILPPWHGSIDCDMSNPVTEHFAPFWDSINGKRPGCSWNDNPWVAAITFSVHRCNIDAMANP